MNKKHAYNYINLNTTKEELYELFITKNLSTTELASLFNVSVRKIRRELNKYNIKKDVKININIDYDTFYQLYIIEGKSAKELASIYNVSENMIHKTAKAFNINKNNIRQISNIIDKKTFIDLYINKNISFAQIAKIYKVNHGSIINLANKYNIKHTKKNSNKYNISKDLLKEKYIIENMSLKELSEYFNISINSLRCILKEYSLYKDKKLIYKNIFKSLKRNGTLNSSISKWEQSMVDFLRETYPEYTFEQQYKDDRYPFACDCYCKELDLFIEFNGKFYHNYRPFEESEETLAEFEEYMSRGGQYENIAVKWRYIDPKKREIAIKNRLNFIEYWEDSEGEYDPIKRWLCYRS